MRFKNCPIVISKMTGKLKKIRAINGNPLTNSYCQKMFNCGNSNCVCTHCYSTIMIDRVRWNCKEPYSDNDRVLSSKLLSDEELPVLRDDIFRFNAHGELVNKLHGQNLHNIAKKNTGTIFGWWTKRINLIPAEKLNNINYIYSQPILNKKVAVPECFDKVFTVYTKEYAKKHNIKINCKGSAEGGCRNCKLCYTKNKVTHINELVK